jgi:predicted HicB family RNase H-like nuclease
MPKQPKPKANPVGRPKLHDQAKSSIVPVRFNAEDRKRVELAAKASNKSVSEWIRCTLNAALKA